MAYFKSLFFFNLFLNTVIFTQIQIDTFNSFNLFRLYWSFFILTPSILATEVKPPASLQCQTFAFFANQNIFRIIHGTTNSHHLRFFIHCHLTDIYHIKWGTEINSLLIVIRCNYYSYNSALLGLESSISSDIIILATSTLLRQNLQTTRLNNKSFKVKPS
jgi:hypothetical protein